MVPGVMFGVVAVGRPCPLTQGSMFSAAKASVGKVKTTKSLVITCFPPVVELPRAVDPKLPSLGLRKLLVGRA